MSDVLDAVYALISRKVALPGSDREAHCALDIFDSGLLDSLGLVELVVELESQFQLTMTPAIMEDPRFRTMRGMAAIIHEQLHSRGDA